MPNTYDFMQLILIGLLGGIANLLLTQSYKLAEVTLTTPLKYLSLVIAIIFWFYFFEEIPSIHTLSGAALIVVSSAIIFIRENQLKKPITLPRQQWKNLLLTGIQQKEFFQKETQYWERLLKNLIKVF